MEIQDRSKLEARAKELTTRSPPALNSASINRVMKFKEDLGKCQRMLKRGANDYELNMIVSTMSQYW